MYTYIGLKKNPSRLLNDEIDCFDSYDSARIEHITSQEHTTEGG